MARKGENIYLRKDGRYEGRYIKGRKETGEAVWGYIYNKQYSEVKRQLLVLKAQNIHVYQTPTTLVNTELTLNEWAAYWMEVLTKPYVKLSTYSNYKRMLEKYLLPSMGNIKIRQMDTVRIQIFIDSLNTKISVSTIHNIYRLLNSMMKEAFNRQMIIINPCATVRKPKYHQKAPRVLTINEQRKIEQEIVKNRKIEYLLCLYTGLRLGELCALKWKAVNFEENLLHIQETVQRIPDETGKNRTVLHFDIPKTSTSMRDIPMPVFISDLLLQMKKEKVVTENDYVFTNRKNNCMDPRTVQVQFDKMVKSLGISGVHIHTLRHTYATRCLETKMGVETLSELLGHSSPQITLKSYAHATMENKRKSVKRLKRVMQ